MTQKDFIKEVEEEFERTLNYDIEVDFPQAERVKQFINQQLQKHLELIEERVTLEKIENPENSEHINGFNTYRQQVIEAFKKLKS